MSSLVEAKTERDAFYWNDQIGRGINLGNMLEGPLKKNGWGREPEIRYFDLIKEAGFDSVRMPVRWSDYADENAPYGLDAAFVKKVDGYIQAAMERKLVVILNIHHYEAVMESPDEQEARFLAIWRQLAKHYSKYPQALYFEVLNEPTQKLTAERWNELQKKAVSEIRQTNPERPILIAPIGWNRIDKLKQLEPPKTKNLIASVHFYEPFKFTHQGAGWVKLDLPLGTEWAGNETDRREIEADFEEAVRWSEENNIPIHVGEFGAYSKADMPSRIRWTRFVREQAEHNRMSWSYWEFSSSFGVYDPNGNTWRTDLLNALIPAK